MSVKYVGTAGDFVSESSLKRAALLFDEIIVPDVNSPAQILRQAGIGGEELNDIVKRERATREFLVGRGIIRSDSSEVLQRARSIASARAESDRMAAIKGDATLFAELYVPAVKERLEAVRAGANLETIVPALDVVNAGLRDILARISAEVVSYALPADIVLPLMSAPSFCQSASDRGRVPVVRVVLEQLPVPADDTPWEAIIEWRTDDEVREKYRQLRAWIAQLARADFGDVDVAEELAAKLTSYQRYMEVQHKKFRRGRLHAILVTIATAAEDIRSFRLSSAVDRLFGVSRDELDLLESEIGAPGREVAYIAQAHAKFRS